MLSGRYCGACGQKGDVGIPSLGRLLVYVAMRAVYRQGHALTTVKYIVLGGSYSFAAMATLLGGAIVTAVTL